MFSHNDLELLARRIIDRAKTVIYKDIQNIDLKASNDAVTNIDLGLQQICLECIAELDPKSYCLSEEAVDSVIPSEAWIIDPLDGTSNFIQNLQPSSIALAKVNETDVLAAIVIDLSTFDIYTAIKGHGAYINNRQQIKPKKNEIKLLGVSTGALKRKHIVLDGWNYRILGSQALQLCGVARGALFANISYEAKAWDDVAGSLIVTESGGVYINAFGNENWVNLAKSQRSLKSTAFCLGVSKKQRNIIMELNL